MSKENSDLRCCVCVTSVVFACVIALTSCEQKSAPAPFSGEFRNADSENVEEVWDFRSDGTFTQTLKTEAAMPLIGTQRVDIVRSGTYIHEGSTIKATQTKSGIEGKDHEFTRVTEIQIEPNGDLLKGQRRLKKQ